MPALRPVCHMSGVGMCVFQDLCLFVFGPREEGERATAAGARAHTHAHAQSPFYMPMPSHGKEEILILGYCIFTGGKRFKSL